MITATVREIRETPNGKFAELRFDNGGYRNIDVNDVIVKCEPEWKVGDTIILEAFTERL